MADWVIAGMLGIGSGTWVYTKISRRSNSPSSSSISAGFVGIIVFIVAISFLKVVLHI